MTFSGCDDILDASNVALCHGRRFHALGRGAQVRLTATEQAALMSLASSPRRRGTWHRNVIGFGTKLMPFGNIHVEAVANCSPSGGEGYPRIVLS